jgi:hypothetical protein
MGSAIPFIPGPKQFRINVSGDSSQQAALTALVGPRRQERLNIQVRAQLLLQDQEPQVLVFIQDRQVGHLSNAAAQAIHRIVRYGERSPHQTFECAALIHGMVGQLDVRLDLPLDED